MYLKEDFHQRQAQEGERASATDEDEPEGLEASLPDLAVRRRVHEELKTGSARDERSGQQLRSALKRDKTSQDVPSAGA